MKQSIFTYIILAAICLLGAWLRFDAIGWGLPFRLHPDEWKYVQGAAKVHQGQWNPKYFRNPPAFTYTGALFYPIWVQVSPSIGVPDWYPAPQSLPSADNVLKTFQYKPYILVLGSRVLSALFGAGIIALTFWTARLLNLRSQTALLATGLNAVSFVSVRESHFAVNDASMAFWVLLVMTVGLYSLKKQSIRWLFGAAALSGIATAFKYSAYPAVLTLLLFRFIPVFQDRWLEGRGSRRAGIGEPFSNYWLPVIRDLAAIGLISIAAFLVICPFPVLDPSTFFAEMQKLADAAAGGWQGQEQLWSGFLLFESLWRSEGVFSLIFAAFGAYCFIRQKRWEFFVFPVLYALMLMTNPLYFTRFSLPLIPWIAIAAAFGFTYLFALIPTGWKRKTLATAIILLMIAQPLLSSLRGNYLLKQEDTRIQNLRWLLSQQEEGVMAAGQFALPLVYWETAEEWSTPYALNIDRLPSNQLNRLHEYPLRWAAVSTFAAFPGHIDDTFRQRLQSVIQFTGSPEPVEAFTVFYKHSDMNDASRDIVRRVEQADVEDTYSPTTRLWQRKRPGPEILIFPVKSQ